MADNKKLIGRDGRTYDNLTALNLGDSFARMEEQKAEDIKKQNKLLEQNMKMQQQIANQNYELELQKEHNKQLEADKQREHEKEMRLLKLFDEVGISKKTYDDYILKNYTNNKIAESINKHYNSIYNCKTLINNLYDICPNYEDNKELAKLDEELNNKCKKNYSNKELKAKEEAEKRNNFYSIALAICIFGGIVSLVVAGLSADSDTDFYLIPLTLLIVFIVAGIIIFMLYNKIDKSLLTTSYNNPIDIDKKETELKKIISREEKEIEKIKLEFSVSIKPAVDELYKFRKEHFNSKIEKLFSDIELPELIESYGCKYDKVNNTNKKKDGTVEDYIAYFENHS